MVLAKVASRIAALAPSLTGHPWIVFFAYRDLLILLKELFLLISVLFGISHRKMPRRSSVS
jgi:hypothetical protein